MRGYNDVLVNIKDKHNNPAQAVAKIILICLLEGNSDPTIKVEWFAQPWEIDRKQSFFGKDEVFKTNLSQHIEAGALDGHCRIMTLAQYETRNPESHEVMPVYFYRPVLWNSFTKDFEPPIE